MQTGSPLTPGQMEERRYDSGRRPSGPPPPPRPMPPSMEPPEARSQHAPGTHPGGMTDMGGDYVTPPTHYDSANTGTPSTNALAPTIVDACPPFTPSTYQNWKRERLDCGSSPIRLQQPRKYWRE